MTCSRKPLLLPTALRRVMPLVFPVLLPRLALAKIPVALSLTLVAWPARLRWVAQEPTLPRTPCLSWEMAQPPAMNVPPVAATALTLLPGVPVCLPLPVPLPLLVLTVGLPPLLPVLLVLPLLLHTTVLSHLQLRFVLFAMNVLLLLARATPTRPSTLALITPLAQVCLLRVSMPRPALMAVLLLLLRRLPLPRLLLVSEAKTAPPLR